MAENTIGQGKFTEEELEKAIISLFQDRQQYDYTYGEDIHRDFKEVLLKDDMASFIKGAYADQDLTDTELEKIISRMELIPEDPLYEGNKAAFKLFTEGFDLIRDDAAQPAIHVNYIDFDEPENNIYRIINQYSVQGSKLRRPDMLLFINGVPVGIFEFKTAIEEDKTIYDAWLQIRNRYNRDIPNLMKYCFLSVITDGANTKMGSIFTPYEYYYAWNKVEDEDAVSSGIKSLITMIDGAFNKRRVTAILRDFILYPDNSSKDEAIVCRYPQFFGAYKMLENIKKHMRPAGDGKGGTYFGATGCGKTYTMLFLARMMITHDEDTFNNPTVIVIVDRDDLDSQTGEKFVNAKNFLRQEDVRSIENRQDLHDTLYEKPGGGVYITTIQKFCESIGCLSERSNIICLSDEAHRTQTGVGSYLKMTKDGAYTKFGFAKYLRDSFPNATYCGFTGTPIDETISVFGDVVDSYTMQQACEDGITVKIAYEPRLTKVNMSDEETQKIEDYYKKCEEIGSNPNQIEESKKAMSQMTVILGNDDRIKKLANDMVSHYEALCAEKPNVVQKAMLVCADRNLAWKTLKAIKNVRPEWFEPRKVEKGKSISKNKLDKLVALPKINLVATQGVNDPKELYELCGDKSHRKMLEKQFKNDDSNFKIAVVVDMWITGFDVPSLSVMYIDKPLQKHTLIQTISRVNRVYPGKDQGLIVDYFGIRNEMLQAVKRYDKSIESPIKELKVSLGIFRNELSILKEIMTGFNSHLYYHGTPVERLYNLSEAAEYVQVNKEREKKYMYHSRILKIAYDICNPSGELTGDEIVQAQFFMAVRSIIYKMTKGNTPDAEVMNRVVEKMVQDAISCTGVDNILNMEAQSNQELFSDDFKKELNKVRMPITRFQMLLKMLRHAISQYGKKNRIKALEFSERLKKTVDKYNDRDRLLTINEVLDDFMDQLTDELFTIGQDLAEDEKSFEKMGISYEEKVFYDILVNVRDTHKFEYDDKRCIELAKKIKKLVDDKSKFADWSTRNDIKSQLSAELTILLYRNGYPPEWDEVVFNKVMDQAENFKKYENTNEEVIIDEQEETDDPKFKAPGNPYKGQNPKQNENAAESNNNYSDEQE